MILPSRPLLAAAVFASIAFPAAAQTPAGMLECNVSSGTGAVVTATKGLSCVFRPVDNRPPEQYIGTISTIGVDIGSTNPGTLSWGVAMADLSPTPYPLAGTFTGATAGVTVGVGAKANTLIGGNSNSISLQPLSISTQTGLAVSAGIGTLTLTPVIPPPPPPPGRRR